LTLVAIVCAARSPRKPVNHELPTPAPSPPRGRGRVKFVDQVAPSIDHAAPAMPFSNSLSLALVPPRSLQPGSLTLADEGTLMSLYRGNIIEPLALIRELRDLLSSSSEAGQGRSRVIFVNGSEGAVMGVDEGINGGSRNKMEGASKIISSARAEAAKLLRAELGGVGIDVCEVMVGECSGASVTVPGSSPGPMCPRSGTPGYHLRHSSEESQHSDQGRQKLIEDALKSVACRSYSARLIHRKQPISASGEDDGAEGTEMVSREQAI
jgi:hypothetical protein